MDEKQKQQTKKSSSKEPKQKIIEVSMLAVAELDEIKGEPFTVLYEQVRFFSGKNMFFRATEATGRGIHKSPDVKNPHGENFTNQYSGLSSDMFCEAVKVGDTIYRPINGVEVTTGLIKLPTGIRYYESEEILIEDIKSFIKRYLDVSEDYLEFASYYVLLSWIYDKVDTIPYLRAMGDTGVGKSRFMKVIGGLCYKPMFLSGATTPAVIFRLLDKWRGTLCIDEGDFKHDDEKNEIIKILNVGFQREPPVARADKDNPKDVFIYQVYGPKVITTRFSFYDKALESRCLTEKMRPTNRKDIPFDLWNEFYEEQEVLRNQLLLFRVKHYFTINSDAIKKLVIPNGIEPRLKQATGSFAVLFNNDALRERYMTFLAKYNQELIEERSQTNEGMIVNAVHEFISGGVENITPQMIVNKIMENDHEEMKTRSLGRYLKALGMPTKLKKINGKALRVILLPDVTDVTKLVERYVPNLEKGNDSNVCNITLGREKNLLLRDVASWGTQTPTPSICDVTNVTNVTDSLRPFNLAQRTRDVALFYVKSVGEVELEYFIEKFGVITFQNLKQSGEIFEPRSGWVRCLE